MNTDTTWQANGGDWRLGLPHTVDRSSLPVCTGAIRYDSRRVRTGDVFVCIPGVRTDGHNYAVQADQAGAIAIVASRDQLVTLPKFRSPIVGVSNPRRSLSTLAAAHEGFPAQRLVTIGVTGTDGKTTTAHILADILRFAGYRVGLVSTVSWEIDGHPLVRQSCLTTPESPEIHRVLAEMVRAGCTHAIIECSSHGLALDRVSDCCFDGAILTSLSADHLDFHRDRQAYIDAKMRLFKYVARHSKGWAVVNRGSEVFPILFETVEGRGFSYGVCVPQADIEARNPRTTLHGSAFELCHGSNTREIVLRMPGRFNIENALAAYCASQKLGVDNIASVEALKQFSGVRGRMQSISGAPFRVIVDYAHTPEAMTLAIATIREHISGRLIVVFGCPGERWRERRKGLAAAVACLADFAIVTDDDPRSESSSAIIEDIADELRKAGAKERIFFELCPSREAAIDRAFALAAIGDAVLLAGKGHEATIEYADRREPWDEAAVAQRLLAMRFG